MASLRRRSGRWQARVSRKGHGVITKTFLSKEDALKWARSVERTLDLDGVLPRRVASHATVDDLIRRYKSEVLPKLRGAATEVVRLNTISRLLGHHRAEDLTPQVVARFRDKRLEDVSPSTCLRELQSLSAMLTTACREWQTIAGNPVAGIKKPSPNKARDRRLDASEEARLLDALTPSERLPNGQWGRGTRNVWLKPLVQLAIETAMRRGELLSLTWEHIDLQERTVFLPTTKNGFARYVPLSSAAVQILERLPRTINGKVFPLTPNAVRHAFNRVRAAAGLDDLHLHDLRHEGASRLSERLNVLELAALTGHRDLRMLQRYTHPRASELAKKLG